MKSTQKLILILGLIWIGVKLTFFFTGNTVSQFRNGVTLNFGFVLFIIYQALQSFYKTEEGKNTSFTTDLRVALRASLKYIIIVFAYLTIHYTVIEPDAKEELFGVWRTEQINEQGGYEAFLEKNIELHNSQSPDKISREEYPETLEEFIDQTKVDVKENVSNWIFISIILMLLFLMTLAMSSLGAAVFKKFMRGV